MRNKKNWIIAVKIVVFVLLFCLMAEGLGVLVYPKTGETTPKIVLYRQETEAPDVLMLGTSAMYRAIIPLLLDEITGLETVDMCTPAQTMLSSYTLLKDTIKQGKVPDTLILYTNIRRFCRETGSNYDYQVMANLPMSLDKLEMMYNGFETDDWPEAMLKAVRGRENFTLKAMRRNLNATYKLSTNPEEAPEALRPYIGKGYAYETEAHNPASVDYPANAADDFVLAEANTTYYDKIIQLCNEHGIKVIMLSVPRLPATVIQSGDYEGFHVYMEELAQRDGIEFWDLTYVREEHMVVRADHFRDGYHGNSAFAEPFTRILGSMLNDWQAGTLDKSQYLYDDFATYLELHRGINAIHTKDKLYNNSKEKNYMDVNVIVGADTEAEFRVLIAPAGSDEFALFRDWGTEKRVVFGKELPAGSYDVKLEARQIGSDAVEQSRVKTFDIK